MSFNIIKAGRREEVQAAVRDANVYGNRAGEAVKALIDAVLEMSDAESVIVEASGHSPTVESGPDARGHTNVTVTIRPAF